MSTNIPSSPRNAAHVSDGAEWLIENEKDGSLLVLVPGGSFFAGDGRGFPVDLPPFYMAVHPVTNRQYARFVRETGHPTPELQSFWVWKNGTYPEEVADHPVVHVAWNDAKAYGEWAGLRLPSELEWEKAARGIDGRKYPWGEGWDKNNCHSHINTVNGETTGVWNYGVGVSPRGAYQMSGNVDEWCEEWYSRDSYKRYKQGDIKPPKDGHIHHRVLRGGYFRTAGPEDLTATHRSFSNRSSHVGFRCVMSVDVTP